MSDELVPAADGGAGDAGLQQARAGLRCRWGSLAVQPLQTCCCLEYLRRRVLSVGAHTYTHVRFVLIAAALLLQPGELLGWEAADEPVGFASASALALGVAYSLKVSSSLV